MTSRKRGWLGIGLILVFVVLAALAGGYRWAWLHYVHELKSRAEESLAEIATGGRRAECPGMEAGGFPLRLELSCKRFVYADPGKAVEIATGAVRSAASITDPLAITGNVRSPARVTLAGLPPLRLEWRSLKGNTRLARPLPEHVAILGRRIEVSPAEGGEKIASTRAATLRASPAQDDLDLRLKFDGLALGDHVASMDLPPLDGQFTMTLANGLALLVRPPQSLRGLSGRIRSARVSSGEAAVELSGPVAVDADGLVNARLSLEIHRPEAVAAILADALPDKRDEIGTAFQALMMLGGAALPLNIDKGKVYLGFIKIGDVPRLR